MNERQPYEEQLRQQWQELPLPDENLAWEDMKRRLDEDDDDGVVAWWRRGCMLWGFLLLALLGMGWWVLQQRKDNSEKITGNSEKIKVNNKITADDEKTKTAGKSKDNRQEIKIEERIDSAGITAGAVTNTHTQTKTPGDMPEASGVVTKKSSPTIANRDEKKETGERGRKSNSASDRKITGKAGLKTGQVPGKKSTRKNIKSDYSTDQQPDKKDITDQQKPAANNTGRPEPGVLADKAVSTIIEYDKAAKKIDSTATAAVKEDSVRKKEKKDSVLTKTDKKKKSNDKKPIFFSAGVSVHQQLPVAGQKFTPYNASGRKGSIADYIPAPYFRVTQKDRWFVQLEFRYGAPQYTKQFIYQQEKIPSDTSSNPAFITTTSYNLKKTFYHQLPLTFHYYILPGWSVGAGIQWNRFSAAVAEKDISRRYNFSQQDTVLYKEVVKQKNDSATIFSKNYFQGVVESQYQWKRFSLGARYSFGINPFVEFTLPDSAPVRERNNVFQVFLRYRLWKSKEKK